jgi:hypothetical protein
MPTDTLKGAVKHDILRGPVVNDANRYLEKCMEIDGGNRRHKKKSPAG